MRILTKFRVDSESAIKTCNFEKVYTSDPKQAISKKFTLLTQNSQFRKSLHFWPKTVNFEKVYTSDPKHAISKKFTLLPPGGRVSYEAYTFLSKSKVPKM